MPLQTEYDLEVTIRGKQGAGKTHLAGSIASLLYNRGMQVTVEDGEEFTRWPAWARVDTGKRAFIKVVG